MSTEEWIIRVIARIVVGIYLLRLIADSLGWFHDPRFGAISARRVRLLWTAGCLLHVLHVLLAFAWIHHWDHAQAYEHTAIRTAAVTGWHWGGGLWINYLFTFWWLVDLAISWKYGLDRLSSGYRYLLHGIVLFFVFNATVVFGPRWWTPVFLIAGSVLFYLAWKNRRVTARTRSE